MTRRLRWSMAAVGLVALIACTSDGSFADRDVDLPASRAVSEVISRAPLDLDLDALQAEWRSTAFEVGRLKFGAESKGDRLDLNVALAPLLDRFPADLRNVWEQSIDVIVADPDGSSGSRLQREVIATAVMLANDAELAVAFLAKVGDAIEPSELTFSDLGGVDLLRADGAIISRISDGEADAERSAG